MRTVAAWRQPTASLLVCEPQILRLHDALWLTPNRQFPTRLPQHLPILGHHLGHQITLQTLLIEPDFLAGEGSIHLVLEPHLVLEGVHLRSIADGSHVDVLVDPDHHFLPVSVPPLLFPEFRLLLIRLHRQSDLQLMLGHPFRLVLLRRLEPGLR